MKEKPIIFSTKMVKAILDGQKTMTRRIIKPQPEVIVGDMLQPYKWYAANKDDFAGDPNREIKCPYEIGMKLWVRETWNTGYDAGIILQPPDYVYKVDCYTYSRPTSYIGFNKKWKPSIFMPREASRTTLEIINIRVERLQNISPKDAIAEGIVHRTMNDPKVEFQWLWDSINLKRGYGWDKNPWVFVISFKIIEAIKE